MAINGVPKPLALALRDASGCQTFIETGTYKGDTTTWAAGEFERVVTIEWHRPRYQKTKAALEDTLKNVKFCNGDSRTRLKTERDKFGAGEPVMMWLDAHWCGNYEESLGTPGECPLIDELQAVQPNDIILIDDARLFIEPPPRPHDPAQWPTMDTIKSLLRGRYTVVYNDVIVSAPVSLAHVVNKITGYSGGVNWIVLTSNNYTHCLPAFAHLFNKHIPGQLAVKVVRYDKRPPGLPHNFSNFAIGNQVDYSFSAGLLKFMRWWYTDLVLIMLEDYWLTSADVEAINKHWNFMLTNPQVAKLDLTGDRLKVPHIDRGEYVESEQDAPFRASLQAAIWRTDYLRDICARLDVDPWQFEKHAAQNDGALIYGVKNAALEYVNAIGGQGNKPGQYDTKKIPIWMLQELEVARMI